MPKFISLLIPLALILNYLNAQSYSNADTLALSLKEAEALFLKNNFDLLAAKYQISEAEAAVIQAKLWDNPNLSISSYKRTGSNGFGLSNNSESAITFQQLIYLAGKRNKRISIEKYNSQIAEYQFYDLLRTLQHQLRISFYNIFFLQESLSVYNRELSAIETLVKAYELEFQHGNIAFKELARLQAFQFSLQNEKIDFLKNEIEEQNNLVLLTGDSLARHLIPVVDSNTLDRLHTDTLNLGKLYDLGLKNRFDLQITDIQIQQAEASLRLQKAMRIPDLTLGATYDKEQGFIPNSYAISLAIDLPFWNRNQGNIKLAQFKTEEYKIIYNQKELEVKNEVKSAYLQLIETDNLYKSSLQKFDSNYDKLFEGVISAYRNHTISLIEFIDYYEAYKNSKNEYFQLQNNRLQAGENLNNATGKTIIE